VLGADHVLGRGRSGRLIDLRTRNRRCCLWHATHTVIMSVAAAAAWVICGGDCELRWMCCQTAGGHPYTEVESLHGLTSAQREECLAKFRQMVPQKPF